MSVWTIDSSHSSIDFRVRHMGIASVKGQFTSFEAVAVTQGRSLKQLGATIQAASIHTNDPKRDAHLRSGDFFDADAHPEIRFKSSSVEPRGEGEHLVTGELSMRGQTHPISFQVELGEAIADPFGLTRAAAHVRGKLNRTTWGLEWNQILEAGSLLVGEEVHFDFEVQAVLEREAQAV